MIPEFVRWADAQTKISHTGVWVDTVYGPACPLAIVKVERMDGSIGAMPVKLALIHIIEGYIDGRDTTSLEPGAVAGAAVRGRGRPRVQSPETPAI